MNEKNYNKSEISKLLTKIQQIWHIQNYVPKNKKFSELPIKNCDYTKMSEWFSELMKKNYNKSEISELSHKKLNNLTYSKLCSEKLKRFRAINAKLW